MIFGLSSGSGATEAKSHSGTPELLTFALTEQFSAIWVTRSSFRPHLGKIQDFPEMLNIFAQTAKY